MPRIIQTLTFHGLACKLGSPLDFLHNGSDKRIKKMSFFLVQVLIYPSPFPLVRKYIREAMIFLFGSSEVACKAGVFTYGKEIGLPSQ